MLFKKIIDSSQNNIVKMVITMIRLMAVAITVTLIIAKIATTRKEKK